MYRGATKSRLNPAADSTFSSIGHSHPPQNGNHANHQFIQPLPPLKGTSSRGAGGNTNDNATADANIMHMKKSAEIAAIFSGAKINQTTDILDPIHHQHTRNANEGYSNSRNRLRQSYHGSQHNSKSNSSNNNKGGSRLSISNNNRKLNQSGATPGPQEMFSEADMHSSLGYFP